MRSSACRCLPKAEQPALPEGAFDQTIHGHLEVTEERIWRLYVRPRAVFAESIVAALVDATLVEFPAVAWDVEDAVAASPHRLEWLSRPAASRAS